MLFKFAFRNVLRNRRRSFLTALSIFFAAIIVGLAQGWVNGIIDVYIENFATYMTGHVRVTTGGFRDREKFMPVDELIWESDEVKREISAIEGVRAVRERIRFGLLLGSEETTVEALGMGIDLHDNEFDLENKLIQGTMGDSGIYIGYRLAEKMDVKIGEDLLIATRTSEGGLNGIKLTVRGFVKLGMMYDRNVFFISIPDAKRLLKMRDSTTEIYVYCDDIDDTEDIKKKIAGIVSGDLAAESYKEQLGDLYVIITTMKGIYAFIEALILFMASFVIINTMMMAIFERIREIGTMKALGMSDRELFINFTLEGGIIGAAGGILGATVGFLIILGISYVGIDMSAQLKNFDIPIEYVLRPRVGFMELLVALAISIVVPAMAAMIPARYARKLMPAEALRK